MLDIEHLTRELADIHDRIHELDPDDFAARHQLLQRRDVLRDELRSAGEHADLERSDEALLSELVARRTQLDELESQQINMTSQSIAGAQGITFSASERRMADGLTSSLGIPEVQARIGRLKAVLERRGVEIPKAR